MKTIIHSYGLEIIAGNNDKVIRIYTNTSKNKITIDLSQVRDKEWDKYIKITTKYGNAKITLEGDNNKAKEIATYIES
jgi:hypothetical protein